jgi:hypothetical protein
MFVREGVDGVTGAAWGLVGVVLFVLFVFALMYDLSRVKMAKTPVPINPRGRLHASVSSEPNGPTRVRYGHNGHRIDPIETLDGHVVGYICADCDEVLPTNWDCPNCVFVETTTMGDVTPSFVLGRVCNRHFNEERRLWR